LNWEETIKYIRTHPDFQELVKLAYFDENLPLNVERFKNSEEFAETIKLIHQYAPNAITILDIGSGNGISSLAFAIEGYKVTVSEPDPSNTVGAGAIRNLKEHYHLNNIEIYEDFAENIKFHDCSFDVVYLRQAMHHANDLQNFLMQCSRVLKPGGIFFSVRDHVIFNDKDNYWFLDNHPLQKFYGGENAFTSTEYKSAIRKAGLRLQKEIKFYDSIINYYPLTTDSVKKGKNPDTSNLKVTLKKKIGFLANLPLVLNLYKWKNRSALVLNEQEVPGRMYSYIAKKK
jgi:SAM-dependent methyltransferase